MASMRQCAAISSLLLAAALSGCTIPLSSWSSRPAVSPDDDGTALDARLTRCAALGANASADADCQNAWAEARRRILPSPRRSEP
jgi:conjugative transfer region protein TrbK